jgi:hypothetical protein
MSATTEEIIRVCEALPAEKQAEIADFARFLLEREEDAAWESRISSTTPLPKLQTFLHQSATEADEPLDPNRL